MIGRSLPLSRYVAGPAIMGLLLLSSGTSMCRAGEAAPTTGAALKTLMVGPCKLLLPKFIYTAPGRETNLYFDNVILTPPGRPYLFNVDCAQGDQQEDRWTWTPTEKDTGDLALTLEVRDLDDKVVATGQTIIRIAKADAGAGKPFSLLPIGDSLTGPGIYTGEALKLYRAEGNTQFKLLGSVKSGGIDDNYHLGYGGWTFNRFITNYIEGTTPGANNLSTSPFIFVDNGKPVYDFSRYLRERLGGAIPDAVSIFLGCNDNFGPKDDTIEASIDSMMASADTLIAGIRAGAPKAKIAIITTVPPTTSQDAFGRDYHSAQTRWQYRKNQHRVVDRMLQKFEGRQADGFYVIPAYLNLDAAHNFPTIEAPANARTDTKVVRQANSVHPAASGYLQIGDSLYGWLKNVNQ